MVRGAFTILATLGIAAGLVAHSEAKPPPPCVGRFAIAGPLQFGGLNIDAITIDQSKKLSIGACGTAKKKVRGTKKGTVVNVLWPKCQALKKVKLIGRLGTDCQSFTGSFKAKKTPKTTVAAQVSTGCGDGLVDPGLGEACEGSGCAAGEQCVTCRCEPIPTTTTTTTTSSTIATATSTTTTTTAPTTTTTAPFPATCGNGVLDPGEECEEDTEEARANDEDGCTRYCLICGNSVTTPPGETCDDGNHVGGDGCSARCTTEGCGNHVVDVGETCDDGNLDNFDGCPNNCKEEGCTPIAGSVRGATVNWNATQSVGSLTVLVDYPEGLVNLPGTGGGIPAGILFGFPSGTSPQASDIGNQGYALREVIVKATAITPRPGQLFKINFEDCEGATPPAATDFTCAVETAFAPDGITQLPPGAATCSVTVP
jgi:cysteine-rich repeat protein